MPSVDRSGWQIEAGPELGPNIYTEAISPEQTFVDEMLAISSIEPISKDQIGDDLFLRVMSGELTYEQADIAASMLGLFED